MDYIVSVKNSKYGLLVVVTDSNIIGKIFEEGNRQLDLTKKFYQGELKGKEEVKKLFEKSRHLHLTGKGAVAIGVELDLVDGEKILIVKGVPHAEVCLE
ncbi:MAG: DUF424 family protein [Nanoarchaeota archaeon]|nr:DUF424 family protein [Nanoarchaeota archaeon]MBU1644427.1 DUF424 family protein [Nanoarchaeota archaeon]MBU1976625.1 DUF424 family protein [Nanoarchaeota archaeon]